MKELLDDITRIAFITIKNSYTGFFMVPELLVWHVEFEVRLQVCPIKGEVISSNLEEALFDVWMIVSVAKQIYDEMDQ